MEHVYPDVIPAKVWDAIRNMGRAIQKLGDLPVPESQTQKQVSVLVHWRWMDFVEVLEAWTGPNDVEGVERWSDDLPDGLHPDLDAIEAFIADMTVRRDAQQELLEWRKAHQDADV